MNATETTTATIEAWARENTKHWYVNKYEFSPSVLCYRKGNPQAGADIDLNHVESARVSPDGTQIILGYEHMRVDVTRTGEVSIETLPTTKLTK